MVRTVKKKVNPRRIPLPRNAINKNAIIEEAMKDDMAHAWLLVAGPLLDRGYDHPPLADTVSAYVKLMSILSLVSVLLLFGSGE